MIVCFHADYGKRVLTKDKEKVVAVRQDRNVNIVRVVFQSDDFADVGLDLTSAVKKVLYIDPSAGDDTTVLAHPAAGTPLADGTYAVDWRVPASACDASNCIRFALEIQSVSGGAITAAWFSLPTSFQVVDTLTDADITDAEEPEEQASNAEKIAALTDSVAALKARLDNGDTGLAALAAKINQNASDILNNTNDITAIKASLKILSEEDSWDEFERDVKMGYAAVLYPVGTMVEVTCSGPGSSPYTSIQKIVIGHDHDKDMSAPDAHTMTLCDVYGINDKQFDAPEAFWNNPTDVSAGTFNFTIPNYDAEYGGNKSYQFTTAKAHAKGSHWCFGWGYQTQASAARVTIYDPDNLQTPSETLTVTEGNGGMTLATLDGSDGDYNHIQRVRYGSNNYGEAGLRQWANSEQYVNDDESLLTPGARGFNWKPLTPFDMPPSYHNLPGYASWLDPAFVKIVKTCEHLNRTNTVFDLNGTGKAYKTYERFFLLSQEEVGFASESIACGTVYDYFEGMSNEERKVYDISAHTTARYCWLRTPNPGNGSHERRVHTDGSMNTNHAASGNAARLACVI